MRRDGSVREVMWCQEVGHGGVVTERCMVDDDVRMEIYASMLTWKVTTNLDKNGTRHVGSDCIVMCSG